jgi:sec-independent protein translocase protein TatA
MFMFGIGGGELLFILIIVLMFFGSDKIPTIARTLGKGMAQLRNATNDIKSEISKGMAESGVDPNALTGGIAEEINKAKQGFTKMVMESGEQANIKPELDQIRERFAQLNDAELAQADAQRDIHVPENQPKIQTQEPPKEILPDDSGTVKRQG